MGNLVIWSDEILKELREGEDLPVFIKIGVDVFPVSGVEDSQSIGWYEIRYNPSELGLISHVTSKYLLTYLPKGEMVMIQEGGHLGKSYPINSVFQIFDGRIILKCDDPDSEYWAELEKWKIEEDKKLSEELSDEERNSETQND